MKANRFEYRNGYFYVTIDNVNYFMHINECIRNDELLTDIIALRLFLIGKMQPICNIGKHITIINNNTLTLSYLEDNTHYDIYRCQTFEYYMCDIIIAFITCYNDLCTRFFKTRLWSRYSNKWFLSSSNFRKRLTKVIDENLYAEPIAILNKL